MLAVVAVEIVGQVVAVDEIVLFAVVVSVPDFVAVPATAEVIVAAVTVEKESAVEPSGWLGLAWRQQPQAALHALMENCPYLLLSLLEPPSLILCFVFLLYVNLHEQ
ncbi:hypothetical protein G6F57_023392 [Rhizopus arrhizus]|nr:hypothetical protein G6F57_023392 [Rhizopus arrhizus]